MRKIKQLTALILAVLVLIMALPVFSVFAADSDMRYGRTVLGKMSNGTDLQYIYDQLVIGCESAKDNIDINISGRNIDFNNDLSTIYTMLYSDYPEFFWINGSWSASSNGTTLIFKPEYTMSGSALSSAKSAYSSKVKQLTSDVSGSDYEKSKILHDRLIDAVTYTSTSNDQNAYGALVEGKAVCNGYARAYQHLMNSVGIPAWYVRGSSINPSTGSSVGHAWNMVKLDGQWYYTDTTWDDQGNNTFYTYFNITSQQLLSDHAFDSEYAPLVPTVTATAANYYVKEDRVFSGYDQSKLVNLLKKDNNKTQIYINGSVDSFINSLNSNLESIASNLGATGSYSISYNIAQLGNALIINMVVISGDHTHTAKTTVPQKDASCLSSGTKAYYICDCGLKFSDKACTQQVTNDKQLEISAKSHTASGWKNNSSNHWKECTVCGTEIANTRGTHTDANSDNKCDSCGYALPVTDASGNITVDSTTNSATPNQTSSQSDNSSIDSTSSTQTESSETVTQTESVDSESFYTDEVASIYEDSYLYTGAKPQNTALKWILVCGGIAAFLAAGIAVAVILINKKKQ